MIKINHLIRAFYEDDCIKHGTIINMDEEQNLRRNSCVFANCEIFNPDSKSSYIYFDSNGEIKEISNLKRRIHI